jgi:hypothetical protein
MCQNRSFDCSYIYIKAWSIGSWDIDQLSTYTWSILVTVQKALQKICTVHQTVERIHAKSRWCIHDNVIWLEYHAQDQINELEEVRIKR